VSGAASAASATPVAAPSGPAVAVTVFADADRDGGQSTAEPGVDGVAARLYRDVDGNRIPEGAAVADGVTAGGGVVSLVVSASMPITTKRLSLLPRRVCLAS
jgi:hypothetical protein